MTSEPGTPQKLMGGCAEERWPPPGVAGPPPTAASPPANQRYGLRGPQVEPEADNMRAPIGIPRVACNDIVEADVRFHQVITWRSYPDAGASNPGTLLETPARVSVFIRADIDTVIVYVANKRTAGRE